MAHHYNHWSIKFELKKLCPVAAIECYIKRTAGFRGTVGRLFIVVGDRPKSASPQSITRWTKLILSKAGLDNFTVHSGRAAASSCALLLGMPINIILRHAGWRSKHTFARRYMKMPSTTIEDKYGFSKNWGIEQGQRIASMTNKKIHCFIDKNGTDNAPLFSDHQSVELLKLTSASAKSQSSSKFSKADVPHLPMPPPTQGTCIPRPIKNAKQLTCPMLPLVSKQMRMAPSTAISRKHQMSAQCKAPQAESQTLMTGAPLGPLCLPTQVPQEQTPRQETQLNSLNLSPQKIRQPAAIMHPSKSQTQNPVLHQQMAQNRNQSRWKTSHTTYSTEPVYITGQGESSWCAPVTSATASRSLDSSMYSDTTQAMTTISWSSRMTTSSVSVGSIPVCHKGITGWEAARPPPQWDHSEFELIDITIDEGDLPILTEADILSDLGGTSPDDLISLLNKIKKKPAWHKWKFINYLEVEIAHWGSNCFM